MTYFWEILSFVGRNMVYMFTNTQFLLITAVVFFLVHGQYKKIHFREKRMFGFARGNPLLDTIESFGYGLIGGFLATFLFFLLGVSLTEAGILYLWLGAILLMLIHPRFLCFSYSGGILSVSSIIFGFPKIDVVAVMALVSILHLVEASLIWIHGEKKASPVYLKHKSGRIVGGFMMQKFWPLPFIALAYTVASLSMVEEGIMMPNWWPIVKPEAVIPEGMGLVYFLIPVMAALGYSDFSVTMQPQEKCNQTALHLGLFSILLLGLALLADRFNSLAILPALFAPLGHEFVIYLGNKREAKEEPIYVSNQSGVMILDVFPNSPADKMGLRSGDIIKSVNGVEVYNSRDFLFQMTPWLIDPVLEVENQLEGTKRHAVSFRGKVPPIGIIPVPEYNRGAYIQIKEGRLISWIKNIFRRKKR